MPIQSIKSSFKYNRAVVQYLMQSLTIKPPPHLMASSKNQVPLQVDKFVKTCFPISLVSHCVRKGLLLLMLSILRVDRTHNLSISSPFLHDY